MLTILVVEDAPNFLRWTKAVIARHLPHCRVHTATTAREAESSLRDKTPDAVVLDLGLPERTGADSPSVEVGLSLLEQLTDPAIAVPTIVLSSHDAAEHCLTAGAAGFVSKSSPTVLRDLVTALTTVTDSSATGGPGTVSPVPNATFQPFG